VADAGLETCTTAALESGATKSQLALQNRNWHYKIAIGATKSQFTDKL
jgi:hypothetical protein